MGEEVMPYGVEEKPLTAVEVKAQVNLIQEVMRAVMQDGTHYGKIPGAGDKPTLLKPGAEKIMATFRLSVDPEITDLSHDDIIRYQVKCRLHWPSGRNAGAGVGEASTDEEKYKWRATVSDAEWNATPENVRRIKFRRDGEIKQVRMNPSDVANTILKMAKKRALVDAVLTVTAASDIFTQDLEDLPKEYLDQGKGKPPIQQPQKKVNGEQKQPPVGQNTARISIKDVVEQTETRDKKPMKSPLYHIHSDSGVDYRTFDKELAKVASKEAGTGMLFDASYEKDSYGITLKTLITVEKGPEG